MMKKANMTKDTHVSVAMMQMHQKPKQACLMSVSKWVSDEAPQNISLNVNSIASNPLRGMDE